MNQRRLTLAAWLALAYLPLLTLALLAENPFRVAGSREADVRAFYHYLQPVAHLLAFLPLGFLLAAGRWPISRRLLLAAMVCYGLATEALQTLIPQRTFDVFDVAQNIAGLAAGIALGWLSRRVWLSNRTPVTEGAATR